MLLGSKSCLNVVLFGLAKKAFKQYQRKKESKHSRFLRLHQCITQILFQLLFVCIQKSIAFTQRTQRRQQRKMACGYSTSDVLSLFSFDPSTLYGSMLRPGSLAFIFCIIPMNKCSICSLVQRSEPITLIGVSHTCSHAMQPCRY